MIGYKCLRLGIVGINSPALSDSHFLPHGIITPSLMRKKEKKERHIETETATHTHTHTERERERERESVCLCKRENQQI